MSYPYFGLNPGDFHTLLPLALLTLCFPAFWFISQSEALRKRYFLNTNPDKASVRYFLSSKLLGMVLLGVVPLSVCLLFLDEYSVWDYGLGINREGIPLTLLATGALCLLVVPAAAFSARKEKNLINYPQIRSGVWTRMTVWVTVYGWVLYLLGYELLFRGILLIPLADQLGMWPSVAVNTALYSATHIPKGREETFGAIPLGIVLCLLTLATGMIWTAVAVHSALAITNCLAAFKAHPAMVYKSHSR